MIRTTHTHRVQWESHRWRLQQCEGFTSGLCGSLGGLTADRKINDRETEEVEEEEREQLHSAGRWREDEGRRQR